MGNINRLENEFSESGIAVMVADGELNILWRNAAAERSSCLSGLEVGKCAEDIFGSAPDTGLLLKEINGELCTFNVIKASGGGYYNQYYVIELARSQRHGGVVSGEAARGYISYICSEVRAAVSNITSATDSIFEELSANTLDKKRAAEKLDMIYESIMTLESETVYPEGIYSLIDMEKPDDTILLDKEMTALGAGIKDFLCGSIIGSTVGSTVGSAVGIIADSIAGGTASSTVGGTASTQNSSVRVVEDYDRDIYFRMNADSFETAVASMTAECCGDGRYPERIIISARRSGRGRAEVTVMSLDIPKSAVVIKRNTDDEETLRRRSGRSFNARLFTEYVYDALGIKNGAKFSKQNIPGGTVCKMNLEVLPRGASVFAERVVDGSDRLSRIEEKLEFFFGRLERGGNASKGRYTSKG